MRQTQTRSTKVQTCTIIHTSWTLVFTLLHALKVIEFRLKIVPIRILVADAERLTTELHRVEEKVAGLILATSFT